MNGPLPGQAIARNILPAPLPTQFLVGEATSDAGATIVVLTMFTPHGEDNFFLPAEFARQLGQALVDRSRTAALGLVRPNGRLPPGAAPPGPAN